MKMKKINNYIFILAIIVLMLISCEKPDYTILSYMNNNLSLIVKLNNRLNSKSFIKGTIRVQNKTNRTLEFNVNDILITYNDITFSIYRDSIASLYYIIKVKSLSEIEEKIYLAPNNMPIEKNRKFKKDSFRLQLL